MRFLIQPELSVVGTEMRSTVHLVHAQGAGLTGTIDGELDDEGRPVLTRPHGARLELPVSALSSGNPFQDLEMRRRMDVRRHPTIGCRVTRVEPAGAPGRYRARAELSVRGTARVIEGEFSLRVEGGRVLVEAEHRLDMRDFGVEPPRLLLLTVEPEVLVRARIVAEPEVP